MVPPSSSRVRLAMLSSGVFLLLLLAYVSGISHPPQYDELYHVLAARSWADDGTLSIAEGSYTRAYLFTELTGLVFRHLGDSVAAARFLPAVCAAGLVATVFLWTAVRVGLMAAGLAAALTALSVSTISLAQFARFYSLHAWAFFVGALIVYQVFVGERRHHALTAAMVLAAAALFLLCFHLQVTTLIGLVAISGWALVRVAKHALLSGKRREILIAVIAAVLIVILLKLLAPQELSELWNKYRSSPLWAGGSGILYYHWWFVDHYPVFYGLFPAVVGLAMVRAWRPALYCAVVFTIGVAIHSFAGTKGGRYIYYLLPFFFVLCGIAVSAALPHVTALARSAWSSTFGSPSASRGSAAGNAATAMLFLGILFASTPGFYRAVKVLVAGSAHLHPQYATHWSLAREPLLAAASESDIVVTANALSALYFLGDYDVEMSATVLHDFSSEEFDRDPRTGRPVISTTASLQLLMSCYQEGLVIADHHQWSSAVYGIPPESARVLERTASPVPLPQEANLVAYRWHNPSAVRDPECPEQRQSRRP